jgi:hypothetical protein
MLYSAQDIAYSKEQIYEAVWHEPSNGCCHAVENTVFQIRKRIRDYSVRVDCVMSPSLRLSSPNRCTSYSAMYHNIVIFHFPLKMFCTLTIAAH